MRRLAGGERGPLLGIPLIHKDIFCTDGVRTSCGSRMLDNFVAPYDATVVARLKAAGTVMLGKSNMDEFAMGSSNETSYYGPVRNPWNLRPRYPADRPVDRRQRPRRVWRRFATGTDTGGSIRQPAALTGVTGFKPTYGRVSRYGLDGLRLQPRSGGGLRPLAADASAVLQVMAGFDPKDSTSVDAPVPDYSARFGRTAQGIEDRTAAGILRGLGGPQRRADS